MSTKQNKKGSSKKKKAKKSVEQTSFNPIEGIGKKELSGFIFGFIFLIVAVFLLIAFCSYLYTGDADFDILENPGSIDAINEGHRFHNTCGSLGAKAAYFFINDLFGLASFFIIPLLIMLGLRMMKVFRISLLRKIILGIFLMLWTSVFLAFISDFIPGVSDSFLNIGGNHGKMVVRKITAVVGSPGLLGLMIISAVLYLVYVSAKTIELVRSMLRMSFIQKIRLLRRKAEEELDEEEEDVFDGSPVEDDGGSPVEDEEDKATQLALEFESVANADKNNMIEFGDLTSDIHDEPEVPEEDIPEDENDEENVPDGSSAEDEGDSPAEDEDEGPDFDVTTQQTEEGSGEIERGDINTPYDPKLDLESYQYPTLSLIASSEDGTPAIDMAEQNANKDRITHVLRNFGVEISSIKATIGPTITLYEIIPAEGTRISKIRNLEDDIALSLAAEGIRIIAPIPGKGTIGIEVPNKKKCIVSME
ncbi:MAG: DNA translocase FtsK 4TM domain-containing protein, partial [Bacteroidaceae bacterium]|nr:DNA translocase FtsK 4TM domain-containing protein [Bacteroidaceae bacterium]